MAYQMDPGDLINYVAKILFDVAHMDYDPLCNSVHHHPFESMTMESGLERLFVARKNHLEEMEKIEKL